MLHAVENLKLYILISFGRGFYFVYNIINV